MKLAHKVFMRVIPWKCWTWPQTSTLMRWNYRVNKEEFDRLYEENEKARKAKWHGVNSV